MALKALMLRKKIEDKNKELAILRKKSEEFETREAELEAAIAEAQTDEERETVEGSIAEFESDKAENEASVASLENEVRELESELSELERSVEAPKPTNVEERKENKKMETRERFSKMTTEQRSAIVEREDVQEFLSRARTLAGEKRSVSGADLLIPEVMLGLIRHEVAHNSKLLGYVNLVNVSGEARQNIAGAIPEAVWTEMCANINELGISFNQIEVDGFKVGGYIAICNATLEDSDIALAEEIISAIGGAIGKALDKAILFGTGVKMPLGIATRLAQTEQPSDWGANAPAWTDLHSSNIITLNIDSTSGAEFFAALVEKLAVAKDYYNGGKLFWVMNRKTHLHLMAKALAFNSNAALVANTDIFPIVGGTIIEFEDDEISDNEIIGGFGGNYLMAQRAGLKMAQSDQVFFLQDQTVFKGTARYDGKPVAGEAFVIVNFNNQSPTTVKTFPVDYANTPLNGLAVTAAAGSATGKTVLTVTGTIAQSSPVLKYKLGDVAFATGDKVTGFTDLTSGTTAITAAAGAPITVVELDAAGRAVSRGVVASVPKTAG